MACRKEPRYLAYYVPHAMPSFHCSSEPFADLVEAIRWCRDTRLNLQALPVCLKERREDGEERIVLSYEEIQDLLDTIRDESSAASLEGLVFSVQQRSRQTWLEFERLTRLSQHLSDESSRGYRPQPSPVHTPTEERPAPPPATAPQTDLS